MQKRSIQRWGVCVSICAATTYYAGSTDLAVDGFWRWETDNSLLSINNSLINSVMSWRGTEPNGGTGENCAAIESSLREYVDIICGRSELYICEHTSNTLRFNHF